MNLNEDVYQVSQIFDKKHNGSFYFIFSEHTQLLNNNLGQKSNQEKNGTFSNSFRLL